MAKIKPIEFKGFTAEYWMVSNIQWNKANNKTYATIHCYKDEDTRRENINNNIPELSRSVVMDGFKDISDAYEEMGTSKMVNTLITPEVKDEEGNVTEEAVYEDVETNFFADAEDDI